MPNTILYDLTKMTMGDQQREYSPPTPPQLQSPPLLKEGGTLFKCILF